MTAATTSLREARTVRKRDFDPAEMALRGRIGAYRLHALNDSREVTKPARAAFLARFEAEVDPDGVLAPEERQRRAQHARRAYFQQLALKSSRVRRARAARKKDVAA